MPVGLGVNLAQSLLNSIQGSANSYANTAVHVQLHTADPGAAGTAAAVPGAARSAAVTFAAASTTGNTSSRAASTQPSWTGWAHGTVTITHVSLWTASTGGTFLWSGPLGSNKTVNNGDTLTLTSLSISLTPVATT